MSNRLLADVLWEAANTQLWDGVAEYDTAADHITLDSPSPPRRFSCDAVFSVLKQRNSTALAFLHRLGADSESLKQFEDCAAGEERQGVRYMWLMLAMHVAEDEGITV